MNYLLTTAYLPSISYILKFIDSLVFLEYNENYTKRSYRNRANILTSNGVQCLSVPINTTQGNHTPIKEITIDYSTKWQKNHWRAIESAYKSSPYYEYYSFMFEPFYHKQNYKFLIDFNFDILHIIFKILNIRPEISLTKEYDINPQDKIDLRQLFESDKINKNNFNIKYNQVFEYKFNFVENLSIIDLLFNQGRESLNYLNKIK